MILDPFSITVLAISGGFALLAMLLSHVRRPRRVPRATWAGALSGQDAGLLQVIRQLRLRLRLHNDAEVVRAAVYLLQAASQEGTPEHLLRLRLNGQEHFIRLDREI